MDGSFKRVDAYLDAHKREMAEALAKMVGISSISPESGGGGEGKRADFLQGLLQKWGFKVKRYAYVDKTGTRRPSLVTKFGAGKKTLWVIAHIDTVSEGDRSLWKTDPFKGVIKNGRVFGRGTNDNGQAVIASIFALRALKECGTAMKKSIGVVLAADEELGSQYGIVSLMKEGIFGKGDSVVVPDSGNERGDEIEISEKGSLWIRFTIKGRQVHASMPQTGINAYMHAIRFFDFLDSYLYEKYNGREKPFHTRSTFEVTKHEKNLDSTNIIPGTEVSYMDCRVLPRYPLDRVLTDISRIAKLDSFGKAKIKVEVFKREDAAKPTSERAEVVVSLKKALKKLRGIDAKCIGIGGGTVAKPFRERGIPAAVWSTQYEIAHQPNEFAVISQMVDDAKVFAYLCT